MISLDVQRVGRDGSDDVWSGSLTVYVGGEIDMATAPALHAVAVACLTRPQRLVVDLSEVSFMDSSGLAVLVDLRRTMLERAGDYGLALAGVGDAVAHMLDLLRVSSLFEVVPAVPRPGGPMARDA